MQQKNSTTSQQQQQQITPIKKEEKKSKKLKDKNIPIGNSFKTLYGRYTKIKTKETEPTTLQEKEEIEDKFECLTKVISFQSCKIKRLEDKIRKIESLLPNFGNFDDNEEVVDILTKKRKLDNNNFD
jgi:3-methyladenine DNA glycosylase/8-oxoguanine DNA glycosylase